VRRRFSAVFARGLADTQAQREPETALSGPFFSEPGDLGDLPARLKAAQNLGFLLRKGGEVGESHGGPKGTAAYLLIRRPGGRERRPSAEAGGYVCSRPKADVGFRRDRPSANPCAQLRDARSRLDAQALPNLFVNLGNTRHSKCHCQAEGRGLVYRGSLIWVALDPECDPGV
jgi:hypothetical protein